MAPMIPLMAKAAPGVGFAITMSTTYHHPFYIARFFNALDHVTRGRIAWNAVTSAYKNEAANYGFDEMMEHDERYERAQEFLEVACKLWGSVEKDALVADRENGIFADPAKVHRIDHRGRYFNVRGPLPALPSPQQRPVIIQAGLSGPGMDLAATYADMQFSTRRTVASMKQHREALDAKLASFGRKPRDVGILWSIRIQVAESDADAKEKERRYLAAIRPEAGLVEMSAQCRGRHAEDDRRQAGGDALCIRRQRRLHSWPRLFGHGQHPRVRRVCRSGVAAPRPVLDEIHRSDAAGEPLQLAKPSFRRERITALAHSPPERRRGRGGELAGCFYEDSVGRGLRNQRTTGSEPILPVTASRCVARSE
jgi:alkanesulfonate monooxygenase SsuD/methylene tetrahydromethanopterin reductase-like flavin-dependent oxidoreductase (luciferase family)